MLGSNVAVLHGPGFLGCHFKHTLGTRRKGNHLTDGHHPASGRDRTLNDFGQLLKIESHILHDRNGNTLALADKPEQQMLGTHIVVAKSHRLFTGKLHDFFNAIRKHSIHNCTNSKRERTTLYLEFIKMHNKAVNQAG